ncbi:hypothetical protein, partial [Providencia huaxiensis]|uniref:hypothetical protein n=1 Tax=Providencia huaxiensis TaxID=2027290 RepID=UPI0034E550AF
MEYEYADPSLPPCFWSDLPAFVKPLQLISDAACFSSSLEGRSLFFIENSSGSHPSGPPAPEPPTSTLSEFDNSFPTFGFFAALFEQLSPKVQSNVSARPSRTAPNVFSMPFAMLLFA